MNSQPNGLRIILRIEVSFTTQTTIGTWCSRMLERILIISHKYNECHCITHEFENINRAFSLFLGYAIDRHDTLEHRYNELRRSTPSSHASAALYLGIDTSHYFRTCDSSSISVTAGTLEPQRRVFSFMWNPLESSPSSTSSSTLLNFCASTDEITRNGYWSSSQWQTRDCKMKRRSPASTRTCLRRVSLTFVGDSVLGQVSEFLRSGLSSCVAEREELLRTCLSVSQSNHSLTQTL